MVVGADTVMGARMAAAGELTRAQAAELLAVTGGATAVDVAGLLVCAPEGFRPGRACTPPAAAMASPAVRRAR